MESKGLLLFLINQFFKKYFIIITITLFLPLVIFFSPQLGLGENDQFFLYKIFGLHRSVSFFFTIYIIILSLFFRALPFFSKNNYSTKQIENILINTCLLFVFILSCYNYLKRGMVSGFTAYELETVTNFPLVVKELYNGILENDFYTRAISNSPRIIISKLLLIPYQIGIKWYSGIYLYKVIFQIIYMPLVFLVFYKILNQLSMRKLTSKIGIILTCFLILILVSSEIIINMQRSWDIAGFPSIFKGISTTTKHYSLIIGLIYLIITFSKNFKYKLFISSTFLAICTLIHILIGIAFFSILVLYKGARNKYIINKYIILNFIFGIIFPILFLLKITLNPNPLSSKDFIEIYVFETHPFHYLMSDILGWNFIKWICIYFLQLLITIFMRNIILIRISILSLAFFVLPPFIQYIGTEVFKLKFIAIIGLNRLSSFNSFIFCLNTLIIIRHAKIFNFFERSLINITQYIQTKIQVKYLIIERLIFKNFIKLTLIKRIFFYLLMLLITVIIWEKTDHDPLESRYDNATSSSIANLCNFIKHSTSLDAIIFSNIDGNLKDVFINFAIKSFGQRATFSEWAFPFSESSMMENKERNLFYNKFPHFTEEDIYFLKEKYHVTHFLIKDINISKFQKNSYIWKDGNLILFKIDSILELTNKSLRSNESESLSFDQLSLQNFYSE
tara:strand:- start:1766 stop:3793 length:2028 start_codon:yes stop_codon:yes gene_type:complete